MVGREQSPRQSSGKVAWRCTCFNTRRAARAITEFYDRVLAPSGVSATQFTLLGAIAMLGPGPIARLAGHMALDRTTLTRNLKLLQTLGWVETAPGEDRRERVVSLTEDGTRAFERALPLWRAAQNRIEAGLGADRWRRLQDDLAALGALAAE